MTLIITAPLYGWASKYFSPYDYIDCKDDYAIKTIHNTYVQCEHIDQYWEAQDQGTRLYKLELTTKQKDQ